MTRNVDLKNHASCGTTLSALLGVCLVVTAGMMMKFARAQQEAIYEPDEPFVSEMQVDGECSPVEPGVFVAVFSWKSRAQAKVRQRLDVTAFHDGFDRGDFETVVVLPGSQTEVEWRGGQGGVNYYWRVVTRDKDTLFTSPAARFQPEVCPVDFASPEEMREIEDGQDGNSEQKGDVAGGPGHLESEGRHD